MSRERTAAGAMRDTSVAGGEVAAEDHTAAARSTASTTACGRPRPEASSADARARGATDRGAPESRDAARRKFEAWDGVRVVGGGG